LLTKPEKEINVLRRKFAIQATYFNGRECAGPVPTMFSNDPEEALQLLEDPAVAHAYCQERTRLIATSEMGRKVGGGGE
jgi:hypothetical protein